MDSNSPIECSHATAFTPPAPRTATWNVAQSHDPDEVQSFEGRACSSLKSLPTAGAFSTSSVHASHDIPPYQQPTPQPNLFMTPQAQLSPSVRQSSSKTHTAPADFAQCSTTVPRCGSTKHKSSHEVEQMSKRFKLSHNANPALFNQHLGLSSVCSNQPSSPRKVEASGSPQAHAVALPPSPSSLQDGQRSASSTEAEDANDSNEGEDIKILAVDPALAPQGPLGIEIIKKAKEVPPIATQTKYRKAQDDWLTESELKAYELTMFIKPSPAGGSVRIPKVGDVAAVGDLAKRFFNAMINNDYFWGSVKAPVTQLLQGKIDRKWIIKRSYDLAKEVLKYHNEGLETSIWANSENLRTNATSLNDLKAKNEQNDAFNIRTLHILYALQYHKGMVMDVLVAEKSLAYSIILAPKARLLKKFAYRSSNYHRGEQTKDDKAKAAKWKEEHANQ